MAPIQDRHLQAENGSVLYKAQLSRVEIFLHKTEPLVAAIGKIKYGRKIEKKDTLNKQIPSALDYGRFKGD